MVLNGDLSRCLYFIKWLRFQNKVVQRGFDVKFSVPEKRHVFFHSGGERNQTPSDLKAPSQKVIALNGYNRPA